MVVGILPRKYRCALTVGFGSFYLPYDLYDLLIGSWLSISIGCLAFLNNPLPLTQNCRFSAPRTTPFL